jgi:hypothetical protein
MTDFEMLLELRSMRRETEYQRSEDALTRAIELIEGILTESKLTLDEAIQKEEALAYSYGERWKRLGECPGDLPKLEQEHRQMAEWLKELKKLRKEQREVYENGYKEGHADGYDEGYAEAYKEINADE